MWVQAGFRALGLPGKKEALEALSMAGEATAAAGYAALAALDERFKAAGLPLFFRAAPQTPFDTLGDFFRGTMGIMLDMYRRPDRVMEASEKLLPIMFEKAVGTAQMSGNPRVFIPPPQGNRWFYAVGTIQEVLLAHAERIDRYFD